MIEKELKIVNKNGLHTRPAANLVKLTSKYKSDVELSRNGFVINAKSIIGVMTLAAEYGCILKLSVQGEDEEQAANDIEELFAKGFGEI